MLDNLDKAFMIRLYLSFENSGWVGTEKDIAHISKTW